MLSQFPARKGYFQVLFLVFQSTVVPLALRLDANQIDQSLIIVSRFLSQRPRYLRLQLVFLLLLIDLLSICRFGRRFVRLSSERRMVVLHGFYDSRLGIIRKGFWALSTFAKLGIYGQPLIYPYLNYRMKSYEHPGRHEISGL